MGNQDIGADFNNLAQQMTGLSSTIQNQGIAQMITPFNGVPSKLNHSVPLFDLKGQFEIIDIFNLPLII